MRAGGRGGGMPGAAMGVAIGHAANSMGCLPSAYQSDLWSSTTKREHHLSR
jgi:hypothetical protein